MEITINQALLKGIEAHEAGKAHEADIYYSAILKVQPKHPDANHNMGVLAVGIGKIKEALPFFKTAVEVSPTVEQFWLSYIEALIKLNQIDKAQILLKSARDSELNNESVINLTKKFYLLDKTQSINTPQKDLPLKQQNLLIDQFNKKNYRLAIKQAEEFLVNYKESAFILHFIGAANEKLGSYDEALDAFNRAIAVKPNFSGAYNNIGSVFRKLGNTQKALESYKKAIEIQPDLAEAHNNLGNTLRDYKKFSESIQSYKNAINIKPDFAAAHYNMAVTFTDLNDINQAIQAYEKALLFNPNNSQALYNLGLCLIGVRFKKPSKVMQNIISNLLDKKNYVRPKDVCIAAISLVKLEPALKKLFIKKPDKILVNSIEQIIQELTRISLLLKLMSVTPLEDLELEQLIGKLREALLYYVIKNPKNDVTLKFQSAMALQSFTNEYIYEQNECENKQLLSLESNVEKSLARGNQPTPHSVLCLASYKSLNEYHWHDKLFVTDEIEEVYLRQVIEPMKENQLNLRHYYYLH